MAWATCHARFGSLGLPGEYVLSFLLFHSGGCTCSSNLTRLMVSFVDSAQDGGGEHLWGALGDGLGKGHLGRLERSDFKRYGIRSEG